VGAGVGVAVGAGVGVAVGAGVGVAVGHRSRRRGRAPESASRWAPESASRWAPELASLSVSGLVRVWVRLQRSKNRLSA
jgi:hypothetical protein